jgi:hypothetical protein
LKAKKFVARPKSEENASCINENALGRYNARYALAFAYVGQQRRGKQTALGGQLQAVF